MKQLCCELTKSKFFIINGHAGKWMSVHGGNGIGERNVEGKKLEFCYEKELCVANI